MRAKRGREQNARGTGGGINSVLYSPQFRSHQETRMVTVESNDRHLQSHGKKGTKQFSALQIILKYRFLTPFVLTAV